MLEVRYVPLLVAASIAVAVMASFTCLRLTSGLATVGPHGRKVRISQAAFALGGGIWSMHFVGMLAVDVPVAIFYDPLRTMGSMLIAILITGCALMSLHFGARTRTRIVFAGVMTGMGIVSMHYLGMSAISGNCVISYNSGGVLLAIAIAIASSILAMELAYRKRSLVATICGAVVLGLSISAMHYSAMLFTTFSLASDVSMTATQAIPSNTLALIVALSAFVICGLFLLTALPGDKADTPVTEAAGVRPDRREALRAEIRQERNAEAALSKAFDVPNATRARQSFGSPRIPYERDKTLRFLAAHTILFVQADGHYSRIANDEEEFFCPWSISRVEKSLDPGSFIRTHRSYLVNKECIKGFRREGDKGVCILGNDEKTEVPVSRGRLPEIQELLGI